MQYISVFLIISISIFSNINAQNTEEKLNKLREQLGKNQYDAYIIPSEDEHQSEYVSAYDKRRAWISGFSGSSGVALVTKTNAALWTDSRYYLEAEQEIDKNFWTLMKASEPSTPKIEDWLKNDTSIKRVGQNAKLTSIKDWQNRENILKKSNIEFVSPDQDLIDLIWTSNRSSKPNTELYIHELQFAGKNFTDKLNEVQNKIKEAGASVFVATALDEIAWLFNIRGSDIPYNPMFFSYAIISSNTDEPHQFFINQTRSNFEQIRSYLSIANVEIKDYDAIRSGIKSRNDIVWISPESSYYIYNAVDNKTNLISQPSPIRSLKAVKNEVELKVTRECQIRDSVARIKHMHWLETEIKKGTEITEKTSAQKLREFQSLGKNFKDLSFNTISAVGPNAAKVHYSTERGTNEKLTTNKIYLLDAGAQYLDCTTDITRTHHYGVPSAMEKMTYTKVLQGSINMAKAIFPPGLYGRSLDIEARSPLWNIGLDYGHGTGHGIGHFLSVHENPPTTSYNSKSLYDEPFAPGMITSDEPGYYEDGEFGIRLETDLEVVEASTEYKFRNRTYLKFSSLSLVPFERNLIDSCLLTDSQIDWLNAYYDEISLKLGPELDKEHKDYLMKKIEKFKYSYKNEECENYFNKSNSLYSFKNYFLIMMMMPIVMVMFE